MDIENLSPEQRKFLMEVLNATSDEIENTITSGGAFIAIREALKENAKHLNATHKTQLIKQFLDSNLFKSSFDAESLNKVKEILFNVEEIKPNDTNVNLEKQETTSKGRKKATVEVENNAVEVETTPEPENKNDESKTENQDGESEQTTDKDNESSDVEFV